MHILHIVGARPNFIKAAPVIRALSSHQVRQTLVHTGQHFDAGMSDVFFEDLELPHPDVNLGVGSGSHAVQTGRIMEHLEPVLLESKPDRVLVYGDINSTLAGALVSAKLLLPLAHVEAGLRSSDKNMPEEINRIVTDQLADLLFTPSADADANLRREGISRDRIQQVGNVMIDTLVRLLPRSWERWPPLQRKYTLERYALVTLHRPSNVDDPQALGDLLNALGRIGEDVQMIFPVHPRTRKRLVAENLAVPPQVHLLEPQGYLDFLALQCHAAMVITDSGGIQEETTYLGIPCLTLRENTERPVTISIGTNKLVGHDMDRLQFEVARILSGKAKRGRRPPLWDGHTAERIAAILMDRGE